MRCVTCRPKAERIRTTLKDRERQWRRSGIDMTPERFLELQVEQMGCCAICERPVSHWHVDHDHETGATRGLLCMGCNMVLGQMKDDVTRLRAAANYLETHRTVHDSNRKKEIA